jgi:3-hydroxybutyryl-CoA dehydrogenase
MDIHRVAVAGTGMMGPGIAVTFALGGFETILVSRTQENALKGVAAARSLADRLLENGLSEKEQAIKAKELLIPSTDPEEAARSAQLFVESISENLPIKQEFFTRLDRAAPETILCSNTSGLSITEIGARCQKPERILTTHFWMPPYLIPLVEVIAGRRTDLDIAQKVMDLLRTCGKVPVLVRKDVPGQLGNRIQYAMIRECLHIVAEGIATAEDVDLAIKKGFGIRLPVYGVFEHMDMVGLDLIKSIQDYLARELSDAKETPPIHLDKIAKGELGAKSGRGFLDWPQGKADQVKARRDSFIMEFLRQERADKLSQQLPARD